MNDRITVHVTKMPDRKYFRMYYVDPITEKPVCRSTNKTTRREAEHVAAVWQDELRKGRYHPDTGLTWAEFRRRYEDDHLATLAPKTQENACTAFNHLKRIVNPKRLNSLTSGVLNDFKTNLRRRVNSEESVDAYLRPITAALNWAVTVGLLPTAPKLKRRGRPKGSKRMRGRPITGEEFDRLLEAIPKARLPWTKKDKQMGVLLPIPDWWRALQEREWALWRYYLRGLWLSGLRLEESVKLSWDPDELFRVDFSGDFPCYRIYAEAQKGRRDEVVPLTPDFAELLQETPGDDREGRVFKLTAVHTGRPLTPERVGRVIGEIGKAAGVIVKQTKGIRGKVVKEYASAHDFRRTFATRWAPRVKPAVLAKLLRDTLECAMQYYVDLDADEMARGLWQMHGKMPQKTTTFTTSGPSETPGGNQGAGGDETEGFDW